MLKDKHIFICGITGSGKTTYALKLFRRFRGFKVFTNTQYEPAVEKAGVVCNNVDEIAYAFNTYKNAVIFNPPERPIEEIERLRKLLFTLGKLVEKERPWCLVVFDEAHNFGDALDLWFTQGRRWGVKCIAISQRPALTSHTILTQCDVHVIFKVSPYETPYFERYRIPIDEIEPHINKRYHFAIVSPYGLKLCEPIKP